MIIPDDHPVGLFLSKILIGVSDDDTTWIIPGVINDNLQRKFKPMVLMTGLQKKRCSVLANPSHLRVC